MLPISDIPVCLREFAAQFRKVFRHPAQQKHFEEILAGLILAENRTVAGIQQKLMSDTDYDSLQHFMTDSPWSHDELREQRLVLVTKSLSKEPASLRVIAIDSTLVHHTGADIHGVYWYWDYVNHHFCLGQKLVVSSFVASTTVVPLGMELYHRGFLPEQKLYLETTKPAPDAFPEVWDEYNELVKEYEKNCKGHKTQLDLAGDLVDECERNNIPKDVYVLDGGFLDIALMDRIEAHRQAWVCRLAKNRSVQLPSGKFDSAEAFALSLKKEDFKPVEVETRLGVKRTYWVFAKNVKVKFWKKLRMVISYDNPNLEGEPKYFLSNKLNWVRAQKILQPYMLRDPIEHLFRDEKQELGLEKCQQRKKQAVLRFWELSFVAHTFLEMWLKVDYPEGMPVPRSETIGQKTRFMEMKILQSFIARIKDLVLDAGSRRKGHRGASHTGYTQAVKSTGLLIEKRCSHLKADFYRLRSTAPSIAPNRANFGCVTVLERIRFAEVQLRASIVFAVRLFGIGCSSGYFREVVISFSRFGLVLQSYHSWNNS